MEAEAFRLVLAEAERAALDASSVRYEPSLPPAHVGRGARNLCFINAAEFVADNPGWSYVEGFAVLDGEQVHHAWVYRQSKRVALEVTWPRVGTDYQGVRLDRAITFAPGLLECYGQEPVGVLIKMGRAKHRGVRRPALWDTSQK